MRPGPMPPRPALVRQTLVLEDQTTGRQYGALRVSYCTGTFDADRLSTDFVISDAAEYTALGLHKPTLFSVRPTDVKQLPWCSQYFCAPGYRKSQAIVAGVLSSAQIAEFERLKKAHQGR